MPEDEELCGMLPEAGIYVPGHLRDNNPSNQTERHETSGGHSLVQILASEFPELIYEKAAAVGRSCIHPMNLISALHYVRNNHLIEDAQQRLSESCTPRAVSIKYPIIFEGQKQDFFFKMYVDKEGNLEGLILSQTGRRQYSVQVELIGISLKKE